MGTDGGVIEEGESTSDIGGRHTFVVAVDRSLDEFSAVVGFEASDDALVFWLDMCGEVRLEVFDADVLKVRRYNVTREIILKEKDFSSLCLKFLIPLLNPILI